VAYLSLNRRWRPRSFHEVTRQEHVTRTLQNAIKLGRVAQAYLFGGRRGTGKTTMARLLAMCLNCEAASAPTDEPCGKCSSCSSISAGSSPDVIELDAASNRGIDEIRSLQENVRLSPMSGRFKVYIIDEAHQMTKDAYNAFLKTLEEPPAHVVFVLATTEPEKILPTVRSRCQRFDFRPVPETDIVGRLRTVAEAEKIQAPDALLALISRKAEGSLRDALGLLEQCVSFAGESPSVEDFLTVTGGLDRDALRKLVEHVAGGRAASAIAEVDAMLRAGRDPGAILGGLVSYLRDVFLTGLRLAEVSPGQAARGVPGQAARGTPGQAAEADVEIEPDPELVNDARTWTAPRLLAFLDALVKADGEMRYSPQPRLVLEMVLLGLANAAGEAPVGDGPWASSGDGPRPAAGRSPGAADLSPSGATDRPPASASTPGPVAGVSPGSAPVTRPSSAPVAVAPAQPVAPAFAQPVAGASPGSAPVTRPSGAPAPVTPAQPVAPAFAQPVAPAFAQPSASTPAPAQPNAPAIAQPVAPAFAPPSAPAAAPAQPAAPQPSSATAQRAGEPPAAPRPGPGEQLTLQWLRDNWEDLLNRVRKKSVFARAFLLGATPIGFSDGVVTLSFGAKFHKEQMEVDKNRRICEEALSEATGVNLTVRCRLTASAEAGASPQPGREPDPSPEERLVPRPQPAALASSGKPGPARAPSGSSPAPGPRPAHPGGNSPAQVPAQGLGSGPGIGASARVTRTPAGSLAPGLPGGPTGPLGGPGARGSQTGPTGTPSGPPGTALGPAGTQTAPPGAPPAPPGAAPRPAKPPGSEAVRSALSIFGGRVVDDSSESNS
jgi:DNA polymerase-3 subunit gamma/tau